MDRKAKFLTGLFLGAAVGLGGVTWVSGQTAPTPKTNPFYMRLEGQTFDSAANQLQEKGVIKNAAVFQMVAKFQKKAEKPHDGTYQFRGGMTVEQVMAALKRPLKQMVRIPEGWWIARVAKRLEEKGVCTAQEYIEACKSPEKYEKAAGFDLPSDSLEGYLYPDTYDLPPMIGADAVVRRQLAAFKAKVIDSLKPDGDIKTILTVASMVESEAAVDKERPIVAGVITNRIAKKQRLEIDATVLYGLQEWRELGPGEVRKVDSPYNTYLIAGLPPGPICSPSAKSIEAAMKPADHTFLYYVARPTRTHYFSSTYPDHLAAIRKARAEFREARKGST